MIAAQASKPRYTTTRSATVVLATTSAPAVENGDESTTVAEIASALTRPVTLTVPCARNGAASTIIAPRMPALDANAEVTAPTTQISNALSSGASSATRPKPIASTVPARCNADTYVTMPHTSSTTSQGIFRSAP